MFFYDVQILHILNMSFQSTTTTTAHVTAEPMTNITAEKIKDITTGKNNATVS